MIIVLFVLVSIPLLFVIVGYSISAPSYEGPVSDHFNGKKFTNPAGVKEHGFAQVIKWMMNRERGPWKEVRDTTFGQRPLLFYKDGIRVTFVNHSTFLIQVDSLNILTDPIWSERASPFTWAGPKRMRPPGIRLEDLPRIHAVLISHNHYDHLDLPTLRTLFGAHHPQIITPLGVKAFLEKEGISVGADLDWWKSHNINEQMKVTAVPAQHFSGRGIGDRDATLWCGYVIQASAGNIYFAGDTGYHPETFREIGARAGAMKLSLLPIGSYKPHWFMSPVHVSPEEAVRIHMDVRSTQSVGMHFGTFPLGDDGMNEPVEDLRKALEKFGKHPEEFRILKEGEPYNF